jgi:hypothetical protein
MWQVCACVWTLPQESQTADGLERECTLAPSSRFCCLYCHSYLFNAQGPSPTPQEGKSWLCWGICTSGLPAPCASSSLGTCHHPTCCIFSFVHRSHISQSVAWRARGGKRPASFSRRHVDVPMQRRQTVEATSVSPIPRSAMHAAYPKTPAVGRMGQM